MRPIALITGIGPGLGVALARAFAADGYDIAGMARTARMREALSTAVAPLGALYTHLTCDVADGPAMAGILASLTDRIEVAVHNAARLIISDLSTISAADFEDTWRVSTLGAFNLAQAVLPGMATRGRGTLIFTGATASLRGGARFSAFASAKFALRGLAQVLAREYQPKGVHVAHVVVDGLIDAPQTDVRFGPGHARLSPDAVAKTYLQLARQDRSVFTHELDLRPGTEVS